jgi:DNA repair protein RadC
MSETLELLAAVLSCNGEIPGSMAAAERLLRRFESVQRMAHSSREEIRVIGGLSERQASSLSLALELGREACSAPLRAGERCSGSLEIYHRYRARFFSADREYFFSLHLNSKNQVIREVTVAIGSLNCATIHPREVFSPAVRDSAAALVFLHNHPSGDPKPSQQDHDCTRRLIQAGAILGIRVLDHIVLGHDDYYSFADTGTLAG